MVDFSGLNWRSEDFVNPGGAIDSGLQRGIADYFKQRQANQEQERWQGEGALRAAQTAYYAARPGIMQEGADTKRLGLTKGSNSGEGWMMGIPGLKGKLDPARDYSPAEIAVMNTGNKPLAGQTPGVPGTGMPSGLNLKDQQQIQAAIAEAGRLGGVVKFGLDKKLFPDVPDKLQSLGSDLLQKTGLGLTASGANLAPDSAGYMVRAQNAALAAARTLGGGRPNAAMQQTLLHHLSTPYTQKDAAMGMFSGMKDAIVSQLDSVLTTQNPEVKKQAKAYLENLLTKTPIEKWGDTFGTGGALETKAPDMLQVKTSKAHKGLAETILSDPQASPDEIDWAKKHAGQ